MNETPTGDAAKPAAPEKNPAAGVLLKGASVAPGLVLGPVHRKDYDLSRASMQRVPLDQVERELNRFHQAVSKRARNSPS